MRVLLAALVLMLCAWRTHERAQDWRHEEALWRSAVAVSPDLPRPALNLGIALERRGAVAESAEWIARAAALAVLREDRAVETKAAAFLTWITVMHASDCCSSAEGRP